MSKPTFLFFSTLLGTAGLMFLAQTIEYVGYDYMKYAGILACVVVLGTLTSIPLAVVFFKRTAGLNVLLATGCVAGLPLVVAWLLGINGTPLNVHGLATLGWIFYALGSEACAIGLLIAAGVRKVRSRRHSAS